MGRDELVDALRYLHESANMDYDAAAVFYLKNNEAKWRSWVDPVDPAIADLISAALAAR